MNNKVENKQTINTEELLNFATAVTFHQMDASLSNLQQIVLRECCQNRKKTYDRIAIETGYSCNYLKKKVIPRLWHLLSEAFGEKVTKANCGLILKKYREFIPGIILRQIKLESPEGPVPVTSDFYIGRPVLEWRLYEEIQQPGALIRLKGPSKIGKTTVLARTLASAEKKHYHTMRLNLNRSGSSVLSSPDRFFRWFCADVTEKLGLEARLEDYWEPELGAVTNCCVYFQKYLLRQIEAPIILGLDELDRLLEHPVIARDFFAFLQSWYEEAKDCPLWQKLRIVACYCSDACIRLALDRSALNVGLVLELTPFTPLQVQDLVRRHQLPLSSMELARLQSLLGGIPYLTRKFLYEAARYKSDSKELLATAATDTGIFSDHLLERLQVIQQKPALLKAYKRVVTEDTAPMLSPDETKAQKHSALEQQQAFDLESLGLVCVEQNRAKASCLLYSQYFRDRLG